MKWLFSWKRLRISFSKTWKGLKIPKQCKNALKWPKRPKKISNDSKRSKSFYLLGCTMSTVHFPKPRLFHTTQKLWFWPWSEPQATTLSKNEVFHTMFFFKITSFTLKWPYMASSDNNPKRLKILQNHFKVSLQLKKHQKSIFSEKNSKIYLKRS